MAKTEVTTEDRQQHLTRMQQMFVDAIVNNPSISNAEAARQAGYKGDSTALSVVGGRTLRLSKVSAAIAERKAKLAAEKGVTERDAIEHILWGLDQSRARNNMTAHARYTDLLSKVLGMQRDGGINAPTVPQIVINMPEQVRTRALPMLDALPSRSTPTQGDEQD